MSLNFKCPICEEGKGKLHTDSLEYICDTCGYVFPQTEELKEHIDKIRSSYRVKDETIKSTNNFEVPWNGDEKLIDQIAMENFQDRIKFMYLPAAPEDSISTRCKGLGEEQAFEDRKEVENVVKKLKDNNIQPAILFQRKTNEDVIPYYVEELGVKHFIVGEDKTAFTLREKYGNDVYLTASITKCLLPEDYEFYSKERADLYDIFILMFIFNRNLDAIKKLPTNLKYGIMPNSYCLYNCRWYMKHWFVRNEEDWSKSKNCRFERPAAGPNQMTYIAPEDIWQFDPYIDTYKLVDRTFDTQTIMYHLYNYINKDLNYHPPSKVNYNEGRGIFERIFPPQF